MSENIDSQNETVDSSDSKFQSRYSPFTFALLQSKNFTIACILFTIIVGGITIIWPWPIFSFITYFLTLFTPYLVWVQAKNRFSSLTFNRAIVIGFLLRIALSSWTAFRYDAYVFALDGILLVEGYPVLYPYSTLAPGFPTVLKWLYPPIFLYYCGFVVLFFLRLGFIAIPGDISLLWEQAILTGNIYEAYWSFLPPAFPAMVFMFKLPSILADIGIALVLVRLLGSNEDAENKITRNWIFNPFVIFITSIWGMFDILPAFVCLLAVLCFIRKKYVFSGFLLAVGFGLKMYPVFFFFPLVVVIFSSKNEIWRKRIIDAFRLFVGCILGGILSIVPYLFYDEPLTAFLYLLGARTVSGGTAAFSAHGRSLQIISQQIATVFFSPDFLLPLSYFVLLLVPLYLLILANARRISNSLVAISTLISATVISLFLCNSSVTTQNFLWLLPFLFICSFHQKNWSIYTWISRIALIGAFFSYSVLYYVSPLITPDYLFAFPYLFEGYRVGAIQFLQIPLALIIILNFLLASLFISQLKRSPDIRIESLLSHRKVDNAIPIILMTLIVLSPIVISGTSQFIINASPTTSSNFLTSSSLDICIELQNLDSHYISQDYQPFGDQIRVELQNFVEVENQSRMLVYFTIQSSNIDASLSSIDLFYNYTGNGTIYRVLLYAVCESSNTSQEFYNTNEVSSSGTISIPVSYSSSASFDTQNCVQIIIVFRDNFPSIGDTLDMGVVLNNRNDPNLLSHAVEISTAIFFIIYSGFTLYIAKYVDLLPDLKMLRMRIRGLHDT